MFAFLGGFFDFDGSEMMEADEAAIGFAMPEDIMDEDERFSALENAGLDPFDFDCFDC